MPHRIRLPFIMLSVAVLLWAGAGSASAGMPIYPHQSTGNRGSNVMALQGLLRQHGAVLRISGIFDAPTVAAVRAFQAGRGLPVTGMADGVTWTRMLVRLASGSTGEAVKVVQRQLNDKRRAGLVVDGVFGGRTYAAVRTFQRHARLPVTGTVDPTTWRYLISHFQRPTFNRFVCDYQVGNGPADWGTGAAIGQVRAAAVTVVGRGHGPIADRRHRPRARRRHPRPREPRARLRRRHPADAHTTERQCRWGGSYRLAAYDRAATRDLVRALRAAAPGHIKVIYFNDPVLIREGLTRWYTGHDDHVHVRYCERVYPVPAYDC